MESNTKFSSVYLLHRLARLLSRWCNSMDAMACNMMHVMALQCTAAVLAATRPIRQPRRTEENASAAHTKGELWVAREDASCVNRFGSYTIGPYDNDTLIIQPQENLVYGKRLQILH